MKRIVGFMIISLIGAGIARLSPNKGKVLTGLVLILSLSFLIASMHFDDTYLEVSLEDMPYSQHFKIMMDKAKLQNKTNKEQTTAVVSYETICVNEGKVWYAFVQ